jgi:AcrR family transcriptional regulator
VANVKNNSATQETRRRLLAAAGEVFADRGFHAATIKEITDRAGASLASVNYHFSDKAELYAAVMRRLAEDSAIIVPPDDHLTGDPANRLRQFIRYFCTTMMGRQRTPWEQVLMARELAEPTAALDPWHEQVMRPLSDKLSGLIAELLGLPRSDPAVGLAGASVLGQCVYFMKPCALIGRLHPQLGDRPDVERLAAHIAAFSLAGLRDQRKRLAAAHG